MSHWIRTLYLTCVCALCAAVRALLLATGRGGTSLPGRLALRLCPDILRRLSEGVETVLVTGTNGKTTTCALLRHMAGAQGLRCITNPSGANLIYGITAAFVCRPLWRKRPRLAVIECDEGNLPRAAEALRPRVILVTNLFRDQLDRYGEITHTRAMLLEGIKNAPEAALCLNADCSLTATLASETPNPALFFGLNLRGGAQSRITDAPRCAGCGGEYKYASRTFAHLGDWYCPTCGRKRPAPEVAVTVASPDGTVTATAFGRELSFRAALDSEYNLYNTAAALTAAEAMGWNLDSAVSSLADADSPFGRGETLRVGETEVRLWLAKNPAGMDMLLKSISQTAGLFSPVFCLNDNAADGRDVSWIWDCDFESFIRRSGIARAAVLGTRREDMLLRLKYAAETENGLCITVVRDFKTLKRHIAASPVPVCVIASYTAMLSVRRALTGRSIGRATWS